jgi:hypothetical protein
MAKDLIEESIVDELCYKEIVDIKGCIHHKIARCNDGSVYIWG